MNTRCATSGEPLSLCTAKEAFLRESLKDFDTGSHHFRYANGAAFLPLDNLSVGIIRLVPGSDPDDPEFTSIMVEIERDGTVYHREEIEFADAYPMTPRKSEDGVFQRQKLYVLPQDDEKAPTTPRLMLGLMGDPLDEGTPFFSTEGILPASVWMKPAIDLLQIWGEVF